MSSLPICVLQSVAFLDLFAVNLIIPLLPVHVKRLGGGPIFIGLLRSLYAGFQLVSGPIIGCLSDLNDRRLFLLMSFAASSFLYLFMGLTNSIIIILLLRSYLGIAKQTQMLIRAMVPDYEPNALKQVAIYGKIVAACGLGTSISPILGGYFVESDPTNGFAILSVLVCLFFIVNVGLIYYLLPKVNITKKRRTRTSKPCNKGKLNVIKSSLKQSKMELSRIKWSIFWDIFLLRFLIGFAMGIYFYNYSIYLTTHFGLTPKHIGHIVSFRAIVGSIFSYFTGFINRFYTHDKLHFLRNLHVFIMMTVAFLGITFSYNIYLYTLCLVPLAISSYWGPLVNLEMVLQRSHGAHRGTLIGASNSVKSISNVIAPMVGGVIGHYKGLSYVNYASLLAATLGVIISLTTKLKKRART